MNKLCIPRVTKKTGRSYSVFIQAFTKIWGVWFAKTTSKAIYIFNTFFNSMFDTKFFERAGRKADLWKYVSYKSEMYYLFFWWQPHALLICFIASYKLTYRKLIVAYIKFH